MSKPIIGMMGLGRLGLPVAVAIASKGYRVLGYDLNPKRMSKHPQQYIETGPSGFGNFNEFLYKSTIEFAANVDILAKQCDLIFLAIQTPHAPDQDGTKTFHTEHLEDFNYAYLKSALRTLSQSTWTTGRDVVVSIISTMLPGTYDRELKQLCNSRMHMVYNPFFIAMGTVMRDFLRPEFVLLGLDDPYAANMLDDFYRDIIESDAPRMQMSVASAECAKVSYNTALSAKIGVVNTIQMICDAIPGADCQDVLTALQNATDRLLSPKYMSPGMGDGGGCHPRDNLAQGWLMRNKLGLIDRYNWFSSMMRQREGYALFLAEKLMSLSRDRNLPICIYGYAFKANTGITDGSHALLVSHLLSKKFGQDVSLYDPMIDVDNLPSKPSVFLIGANHDFASMQRWPGGSVVVDPWFIVPQNAAGAEVIRVG